MRDRSPSDINIEIKNSGIVSGGQKDIHPRLEQIVRKHLAAPWEQPFHTPTLDAYGQLVVAGVFSGKRALILDSGCGTGKSTQKLAELFPQHLVMGIDRSHVRLSKSGVDSGFSQRGNCVLVRAELATFWRLLLADSVTPDRHFLLYPNPYPKSGHLSRRWHGHPVFPQLLSLGGEIELRCNWEIYAQEFAMAVNFACDAQVRVKNYQLQESLSPFEEKYLERGQQLFSVTVPAKVTAGFELNNLPA